MSKLILKRVIILILAIISALIVLQIFFHADIYFEKLTNHNRIIELTSNDLKEEWNTVEADQAEINKLLSSKNCFDEDLGLLYERAALIYQQEGDSLLYYKYLGYALYYYKLSNNTNRTINIYLDLANFNLNNYSFDEAKRMLDCAYEITPFDEITDLQIKSYAYRMTAVCKIYDQDYDGAEKDLLKSQAMLAESNTNVFEEEYMGMNDVWLARIYAETGKLDECASILNKWDNHEMFTTDIYRQMFLRDFIIPYYQAKCYYLCADIMIKRENETDVDIENKEQIILDYLHEFMDICRDNGYEEAELYTLLKIQKDYPIKSERIESQLYSILNKLYESMFHLQNVTYTTVINNIVDDAYQELIDMEINHQRTVRRLQFITFLSFSFGIVLLIFIILVYNNRFDGLTNLLTRKVFDQDLKRIASSNAKYGIIMIDVDDFKQINDTYGHPEGDIVLRRLGQLISKETTSDIKAYRYGGEEFAIIVTKNEVSYIYNISKRLLDIMPQQAWGFDENLIITLSIGIASGHGLSDVMKEADNNLYISKSNGKNSITGKK